MISNERKSMENVVYQCAIMLNKAIQDDVSNDDLKAELIRCGFLLMASSNYELCIDKDIISFNKE